MKRILSVLLACLFLAACVPTPDEPIVIGKDNEAMIEKAKATDAPASAGTALREQLGCPEIFTVAYTDETKKIPIIGDAEVILPDTDGVPLLYVEADRFRQETVYAFFNRLCGDVAMYEYPTETPKYAIQNQIEAYTKEIDELRAKGVTDDSIDLRWRLDDLKNLQKAYVNAPDEVTLIPSDGTLHQTEMTFGGKQRGTEEALSVLSEPFTSSGGKRFSVRNDADYEDNGVYTYQDEAGNTQGFYPRSGSILFYSRFSSAASLSFRITDVTSESLSGDAVHLPEFTIPGWDEPEALLLSVTPREAKEEAEALLKDLGVADMRFDSIALYTNRREIMEEYENVEEARAKCTPERQAYAIRFLRNVSGVPVEGYFGASVSTVDGVEYGREWSYEMLEIMVDDDGIVSLHWVGPLKTAEIETVRAKLLPFSEIERIFTKMLPIKYFQINADADYTIRLDRVRLCLWRILDRDSYTRGILAPVWCFYGSVNSGEAEQVPILIINAVDGSIIDPYQGY